MHAAEGPVVSSQGARSCSRRASAPSTGSGCCTRAPLRCAPPWQRLLLLAHTNVAWPRRVAHDADAGGSAPERQSSEARGRKRNP